MKWHSNVEPVAIYDNMGGTGKIFKKYMYRRIVI